MELRLKNIDSRNIPKIIDSLIFLGAVEIHIVNETHLETGKWEISFVNYNLVSEEEILKQMREERKVWQGVLKEVSNEEE